LHEAFADIIGHIVEKKRQPAGTSPERSSDWKILEDAGLSGYHRGVVNDGIGGGDRDWTGPWGDWPQAPGEELNNLLHRQDEAGNNQAHFRGVMLSVSMKLLAEGGTNPICSTNPTYQGCGSNMTGVGVPASSWILFDTLRYYMWSSAEWDDIGDAAKLAAFNKYNKCWLSQTYNAAAEQAAVDSAFTRIGYPPTIGEIICEP
jgi:hypothetical protein